MKRFNLKDFTPDEEIEIKTVTLRKMNISMKVKLNLDGIRLSNVKPWAEIDHMTNNLVMGIKGYALGNSVHETIKTTYAVPKTWRDAWKLKHIHKLPVFIQARLSPIQFEYLSKITKHIHMCPHVQHAAPEPHMSFMMYDDTNDAHVIGTMQTRVKEIKDQLRMFHPAYPDMQQYMSDEGVKLLDEMAELRTKLGYKGVFDEI